MVSIIIPSRNEKELNNTIKDLQAKATGDIEIIVILDGMDEHNHKKLDGVKYINYLKPIGMKYAINSGVKITTGEYLMKIDAHCIVAPGFDEQLIKDHQPNWIQVPRRYKLKEDKWEVDFKDVVDYEYWVWPKHHNPVSLHGWRWNERTKERADVLIDDILTFQGSFWFMTRDHWNKHDFMNDEGYNELHAQEAVYLGAATWMSGGRVVVNKNTWYAHRRGLRGYATDHTAKNKCYEYSYKHWVLDNKERFIKLIVKFWPIPNWPEDWQEQLWI